MIKYLFHMADGSTKETTANSLDQAMIKLGIALDEPIGTEDGKPTTVVHIEVDSKGITWTTKSEKRK